MGNPSILEQNILFALGAQPAVNRAFTRALDKTGSLTASESFAYEVKLLVDFLEKLLPIAAKQWGLDAAPDGLMDFILERHWFFRFPQKDTRQ